MYDSSIAARPLARHVQTNYGQPGIPNFDAQPPALF
jgi:hypothetical protein